jgi:predicted O-methyltransferase YrrM
MRSLIRNSFLYRLYLMQVRLRFASTYFRSPLGNLFRWLVRSRETSNFTYDLDELNLLHLASFVSAVTGVPVKEALSYIEELKDDQRLRKHLEEASTRSGQRHVSDTVIRYGRRIGWYAIARAKKPEVIVETGVDKGLGSCVLAAAVLRNRAEGFKCTYYGTDINPEAGFLFCGPYAEAGMILYGDSIESLKKLDARVDFFLNDSDHSAEYEAQEYKTIEAKLSPGAILLGDNAHINDKLFRHAQESNRKFLFFREKPKDHWYPGAGIGVAWR